jgi:AcrR family transcriptional regulator
MSTATDRREREKLAVRTKILDAAREMFAEHGYDAVTMRAIAVAIDYTPTAIYYHFRDKEALIHALVDEDYLALAGAFQDVATIADPLDRLRALGRAYAQFAFAYPNHYRVMFMTPDTPGCEPDPSRHGKPDQDAYAFLRWVVGDAIAAGRLRPEHADVDMTAQLCWAAIHGIISLHITKGDDPWVEWRDATTTVEMMLDVVFRGLTCTEC